MRQLEATPPAGYARWNGALLAAALEDISADQIWRVLRRHGISLERRRSWCVSTSTPGFAMKGTDRTRMLGAVVGKALEPLAEGTGIIHVLVTLQ